MKKIIIFITLIALFSSCVQIMDIKLPSEDRLIALNGILNPDSLIKVNLSRSINAQDGDAYIKFIKDADVSLYVDGKFKEKMLQDTFGYYNATIKPELGKTYKVEVKNNDKTIYSEATLPEKVDLHDFKMELGYDSTIETWVNYDTGDTIDTVFYFLSETGNIYASIDDPADEKNYYFFTMYIKRPDLFWDDQGNTYIKGYIYENFDFDMTGDETYIPYSMSSILQGYVINDDLFNGQQKNLKLNFYSSQMQPYYGFIDAVLYFKFYTLSEEMYKFIKSYNKYEDVISNPFAEPVNIYSNVVNGVGLFAGVNVFTDSLVFNVNKKN